MTFHGVGGCGRPNILLVTTDTQRTDTIAAMGSPHAISPALDRLAAEGALFHEAYTVSPVCSPARTSLLFGVYPPIHGTIENGYGRYEHLEPFTDRLAAVGYTNILVGKTHFGKTPDSFHIQHELKGKKADSPHTDFYAERLRRHGLTKVSTYPNPLPEELGEPACVVDQTIESIEQATAAGSGPFFAWCSIISPHGPYDPPGRWGAAYDHASLPPLNYRVGEMAKFPEHLKRLEGFVGEHPPGPAFTENGEPNLAYIDAVRRIYYGLAAYCDDQIGRLIRYLDDSGLRGNTLVIFTSDHGTQLYDHGFDNKHNYYDASWRVPLIISLPGKIAPREETRFATWTDLTATILGAAGADGPSVQGFDLYAQLTEGADRIGRNCAVATLFKSCALVTRRWKLEYYFEEQTGRLFDRRRDPAEQCDLWADPDYEALRRDLALALLTWRADLTDVHFTHAPMRGGGPVAKRIGPWRSAMRGTDAEERLCDTVARIEEAYDAH